jgi:hypothetical protein
MSQPIPFFLGPELLWILYWVVASWQVAANRPPTEDGSARLESRLWLFTIPGVLLSFAPLSLSSSDNPWSMWLRIGVAGAIGVPVVTARLCGGIDYGDSRNSGVGSAWVLFIGVGWLLLIVGLTLSAVYLLLTTQLWPLW